MMRLFLVVLGCMIMLLPDCTTKYTAPGFPATEPVVVTDTLHGTVIKDAYQWLEDYGSPGVVNWIGEQEAYAYGYLHTREQRPYLVQRFNDLWRYDDRSTPHEVIDSERIFFWAIKKDWERWGYYYQEDDTCEAAVLLDPNMWGPKTLDFVEPSRDGKFIAYGIAEAGNEATTIQIMDVDTKSILSDTLCGWRQYNVSWLPDNRGFYYMASPRAGTVPEGEEHYWRSVYLHTLETQGADDIRIFGHDSIKEYYHYVQVSEDGSHLIFYRSMFNRNQVWLKRTEDPGSPLGIVADFDASYSVDIINDTMIIWTDAQAPNGKVYFTDIAHPEPDHWRVLIPESEDNLLYIMGCAGHLYAVYIHNAYTVIKIYNLDGTFVRDLPLPGIGSASVSGYWSKPDVWVRFSSFTSPRVTYRYDAEHNDLRFYHRPPIKIDLSDYETDQVWYASQDGTRVSMFLIHKKGVIQDKTNPVYLTGYGGFNIPMNPFFSTLHAVWLEAGGMIAIPNLRGGGEYGKTWHEAGMLDNKQNVFDDFIAAAEWLITNDYTTSEKLVIGGGSNGGLLVGAVMVQRPDLFKAVYCSVPLLDMVRYHKFGFANIWTEEYGNADDPEQFAFLLRYSPYHNVQDGVAYPAVLFVASENDARCYPLHAMKMAARMQAANPCGEPVLLIVQKSSGHAFGTTISEHIEQYATIWAFLMEQAGIEPQTEGRKQ
ncbi:S9 family peptidase [candidate division WOR-3 bacterium]|nr:S9 family peptidase [candidate division WOR-3 bacterium]